MKTTLKITINKIIEKYRIRMKSSKISISGKNTEEKKMKKVPKSNKNRQKNFPKKKNKHRQKNFLQKKG